MLKYKQNKKILALSPMDGVTDSPMRQITKKYGQPDLMWTEFVNVEGLHFAKKKLGHNLIFTELEKPMIAQIYGIRPEFFYEATLEICRLGFAGVDINFACPARTVLKSGGGGSMILKSDLAKEIVRAVQKAVTEYAESNKSEPLPVSVKTRIGFDQPMLETWLAMLLSLKLALITIHGRTVKQAYTGEADWEQIDKAVKMRDQLAPATAIFGNGDIKNYQQAHERIQQSGVDGVLIGRGAIGNPWVFKEQEPALAEKVKVAIEHCQLYEQAYQERKNYSFAGMKKHLAAYINNFPRAREVRMQLMMTNSAIEAIEILKRIT